MSSLLLSRLAPSQASCSGYLINIRGIIRVTRRPKLNLGEQTSKDDPLRWQTLKEFRESVGLAPQITETKILRDYPDYTYTDGRATPVTPGQLEEIKRQRALARSIVVHLKEIKFIEDRFAKTQEELKAKQQDVIDSKLKPKGAQLLKPNEKK